MTTRRTHETTPKIPTRTATAATTAAARPSDPPAPGAKGGDRGGEPEVIDLRTGLARMLEGGVIMDVVTPEQAVIAEEAGAVAVMALERVPADIRREGGVARMTDPGRIAEIMEAVTIPVMAKCRIGHFVEAQILEALGVDYIDESEVLTPADEENHVDKRLFRVPFVCGATSLGEALRRIGEGAALIRTKGEAGTGDIVEAVRHLRLIQNQIRRVRSLGDEELMAEARSLGAPHELLRRVRELGRLPVPSFAAGGVSTPADAALVMQLGAEAVFVGSGIFKSGDPARYARAIVQAVARHAYPTDLLEASRGLAAPMAGVAARALPEAERLAVRGW
jgi:pyridoxal 5'-phosphate synthase pdxS subunit